MEAPDSRAVVERLHREEYYPIEVTPQTESPGLWSRLGARGISNRDLVALTQQLATLFEAGLPLDRALTVLEELAPNPRIRVIVGDLLKSVRGGASFGDAMAKHHPRPFSRLYINMVRAGEKGGVLEATLPRVSDQGRRGRDRLSPHVRDPALRPDLRRAPSGGSAADPDPPDAERRPRAVLVGPGPRRGGGRARLPHHPGDAGGAAHVGSRQASASAGR